jgi:hypothetical protein
MGGVENRVGLMTCASSFGIKYEEVPGKCDMEYHWTRDVCMCAQHQRFILRRVSQCFFGHVAIPFIYPVFYTRQYVSYNIMFCATLPFVLSNTLIKLDGGYEKQNLRASC